jgi:archaellum biogenesis ATPase FlaH
MKPGRLVTVADPAIGAALGNDAECGGIWLIYGKEKNGKTAFALMLAKALCENHRVVYISAEEGLETTFRAAVRRAGITASDIIQWEPYIPANEIIKYYSKPRTAEFIFIDNLLVYSEIKANDLLKIQKALPAGKTVIYIAHEEGVNPDPDSAVRAAKLARIKFHVSGFNVSVTSRYTNGGGDIVIDPEKRALFWGETVIN